jgi:hypothetical protein
MQLDKVVCPPGLFNPARAFSVVREDAGLYLIYTGRAMGNAPIAGGVAGLAAGAILDRMAAKRGTEIDAVEAKLREVGAAAMKDTKYSLFFPRETVQAVEISGGDRPGGWPVVVIRAAKKVKLNFFSHDLASVRSLFEPYLPRA